MKGPAQFLVVFFALVVTVALVARVEMPVVHGAWSGFQSPLSGVLFHSPLPTPSPSPTPLTPSPAQIALEHVAAQEGTALAELFVANEHSRSYTLTGRNLWAVTVLSHRTGHSYDLLVDPADGSIVDRATIDRSEREAHQARYGKLEPALQALLEEKGPNDEVKVMIWLTPIDLESVLARLAAGHPGMRHDSERPMDVDDPALAEAIASDYRELLAQAHLAKVQGLVTSLQARGYEVITYRSIPAVVAILPKRLIEQIARQGDVSRIYLTGKLIRPALDSAIPTDRVPAVWG